MKRVASLILALVVVSSSVDAKDLTDAVEILKKVDAATKAVKSIRYDLSYTATGFVAQRMPEVHGTVTAVSPEGPDKPGGFRHVVEIKIPNSNETKSVIAGGDGEEFYLIDNDDKKAYVDMDPNVVGRVGRVLSRATMVEFIHPTPFTDELQADKKELLGSKTIEGVDCYEIHVVYADGQGEATWYFCKKDFLPRGRVDTAIGPDNAKGTLIKVIKNVVVDPKLDKDAFKFKLPKGYTKVDDFAP